MAVILDGKLHAQQIKDDIKNELSKYALIDRPQLAVVMVGENSASDIYVRNKQNDCRECLIHSTTYRLPQNTEEDKVVNLVHELSADKTVHGILVQLPLPKHINVENVIEAIDPAKDVDGFTRKSAADLYLGKPSFIPCTPYGVVELLHHYGYVMDGKKVTILGRSNIVGKPLAQLMLNLNATVTTCHSHTPLEDMISAIREADIVVSAMGNPNILPGYSETIKLLAHKKVLVDVAMNRVNGKLCGDMSALWYANSESYTPVPGGIGPMTRAMLLKNTMKAWKQQKGLK